MKLADFNYHLPPDLIAQHPLPERDASRLLALSGVSGEFEHRQFSDLPELLQPGDLLVFNDTRVIPARLYGRKTTGGRVELLIERVTSSHSALAQIRSSKSPKPGSQLLLCASADGEPQGFALTVTGRRGALFEVSSAGDAPLARILSELGHMPLPPYIKRNDEQLDQERYQTVFADREGAVAAPTAGLHFTQQMVKLLQESGVHTASVTLHVGAGTFAPVRESDVERHVMHAEYVEVNEAAVAAVRAAKDRGGRVVAVGTTAVRSLETACRRSGEIEPYSGETDIFIYPGYRFNCVDAMVTNFHLPESTLLMLVSAFAGREAILRAYEAAIAARYRFFSYGDAMFITIRQQAADR